MGISKEDRKAYEDGKKEADYIRDHPIGYLLTGGIRSRPSDPSEEKAYDKGMTGEQLDEDKKSGGGGCFLSTACVQAKCLDDNCLELTVLRKFRDEYIRKLPEGNELLKEYYEIAPKIVLEIDKLDSALQIYSDIYERLVLKSLKLIAAGKNNEALSNYRNVFRELKAVLYSRGKAD